MGIGVYDYHNSELRGRRVLEGTCRCAVDHQGRVFSSLLLSTEGSALDTGGNPLCTPPLHGPFVFIYAVSEDFEIRIAQDGGPRAAGNPGAIKHETLFHNAQVRAAGELQFEGGRVVDINDHSGSYQLHGKMELESSIATAILFAFQNQRIPLAPEVEAKLKRYSRDDD